MKSDLELVADFRKGDSAAFEKLVRRHQLSLFNFFYSLVQCDSLAGHLTQETFLHVVTDRQAVAPQSDFNISLLRSASSRWLEFAGRMPESASIETPAGVERPNFDAEVSRAFSALSRPLMLVVVLSGTCGLSYGEIADVLELPRAGVEARMNEAYQRLRTQILTRIAAQSTQSLAFGNLDAV